MLEFPGIEARCRAIEEELHYELDLATRMFSFWYHRPTDRWLEKANLDCRVKQVAMALNVQACRQFRSVVQLCRVGEAFNANIIARSLYETTLAAYFVLKPCFYVNLAPELDKTTGGVKHGKWRVHVPKEGAARASVSRERRASLYRAHCVFYGYQQLADRFSDDLMRSHFDPLDPPFDPRVVRAAEKEIGPKWTYILRHRPKTYSGLSVADQAEAVGNMFPKWYYYVYGDQSRMAHAADALQFLRIDHRKRVISATWLSTNNNILCAIYCGITLFFAFMIIMKQYVGSSWARNRCSKILRINFSASLVRLPRRHSANTVVSCLPAIKRYQAWLTHPKQRINTTFHSSSCADLQTPMVECGSTTSGLSDPLSLIRAT
jgi:hypothetical protein